LEIFVNKKKYWMEKSKEKERRHIPVLTWNNCTNFRGIFAQHVVIINSNHKNFFHFVNIFFCGTSKYNTTSTEMKRRNPISKAFSWNCSILRTTKKSSSKISFQDNGKSEQLFLVLESAKLFSKIYNFVCSWKYISNGLEQ